MQEVALAPELKVREHIDLVASYYPAPLTPAAAMQLTGTTSLSSRPYGEAVGRSKTPGAVCHGHLRTAPCCSR